MWHEQLATTVPSTTETEEYGWLDDIPDLREWIGERQVQNLRELGYTLRNKTFELTLKVPREKVVDNRYLSYGVQVDMMAYKAKKKPDRLIADVILAGDSALCYDGQPFFDTDHPIEFGNAGSGVQSNFLDNKALTHENYQAARSTMMSYVGASGSPLGITPNLLVVPPQLEGIGKQILEADTVALAAATATSNAGITNVNKGTAKLLVIPELATEGDAWYLLDTSMPIKPFVFQDRESVEFHYRDNPNDENVFWKNEFVYGCNMRCNAGYALWFLALKGKA